MYEKLLKEKCIEGHYERLLALNNPKIIEFIGKYVELCNPDSVFVRTDSFEDAEYIRKKAIELKEELPLNIKGHTVHFDGYYDQARDKENTRFLVTPDLKLGKGLNTIDRQQGLAEINELLKNIMKGKQLIVLFLGLGPVNSEFSVYAIQLTDSFYVAHSEDILYRGAYEVFKKRKDISFFKYVHSAGELDERMTSKNVDKRRIYIDFIDEIVYSVNTQYAGNTVGLKKLALRLAIRKSDREGWLAEHMFLMGVYGPGNRKSYFTGAFPSACGKTSTCMLSGESIVGDDIAYLRKRKNSVYAVNVERGIFGIIKDVNPQDDPLIWKALTTEGEVIFSNVLVKDGTPYWQGDGREIPDSGINFSGEWKKEKCDSNGKPIPHAHSNARYTIPLKTLENCDSELENPEGVKVKGIIYGGRDSDTLPPVFESFDWEHGVITIGGALESETTSATLGQEGVRKFNPMANLDFLSIPLDKYIENHLKFIEGLEEIPVIFGVNYFLKDEKGAYLTGMHDKHVWIKWMELRLHKEVNAIKTPIGFIPIYEDLKSLFNSVLQKEYKKEDYLKQFTIRIPELLKKMNRIIEIYNDLPNSTRKEKIINVLVAQKSRLEALKSQKGEYVSPDKL